MAPVTRGMRARAAASLDRIPHDALFEALLPLPARELCRLRAVSRAWSSLTSDPAFVGAHSASHQGPLFLARFRGDRARVYVIDLAGAVLKRLAIAGAAGLHVQPTRLPLACLAADWNASCRVLNPATGAVRALPPGPAPEHRNRVILRDPYTFFALGLVRSTGQYKVFRMLNQLGFLDGGEQLFEVLTLNNGSNDPIIPSWTAQPKPSLCIEACTGVVVDAAVYFLVSRGYKPVTLHDAGARSDHILSFDLATEQWRRGTLAGPIGQEIDGAEDFLKRRHRLGLAELSGSLVLVYKRREEVFFVMDMWFRTGFENGGWEKKYTLQTQVIAPIADNLDHVRPVLVLDDGRLVIHEAQVGVLIIWDPRTNSFVELRRLIDSVGVFTGSLLSIQ
ncbi:unnamed protein product [Urochloa decumbens]|uniref:F-box domain-containing protein n=1 Tax=Urochloa decumbens TaxID=240449 RepID=A0ABC9G8E9_9POAL